MAIRNGIRGLRLRDPDHRREQRFVHARRGDPHHIRGIRSGRCSDEDPQILVRDWIWSPVAFRAERGRRRIRLQDVLLRGAVGSEHDL